MLVLGLLLVLAKALVSRSWDPYFVLGFAGMVAACALQSFVAYTEWWYHVAGLVTA